MQGKLIVTYADGTREGIKSGDLFYWPPGNTVKVGKDAEGILFRLQDEHRGVIDHMLNKAPDMDGHEQGITARGVVQ